MRWRLVVALALAALAGPVAAKAPKLGDPAPDAKLKLMDGSTVQLSQLRGQVVVLNFWATWCGPCRRELPLLDAYYRIQKHFGLAVYAVTTEDSVPTYKLKPLFAAMAIPAVRSIHGPYETLNAVPTNYVIDRAGRVRYMKAAAFELDDLNREIAPLLKEPAPADAPAAAEPRPVATGTKG